MKVRASDLNDPTGLQLPVNLLSNVALDLEALMLKLTSKIHVLYRMLFAGSQENIPKSMHLRGSVPPIF